METNPDPGPAEPTSEREVIIRRRFDAPARLVFEAFSTAEAIRRWFGPKGWSLTLCEMDFRVGGRYRFAMTGPDGRQGPLFGGEYLEIVPNRKLVYDDAFEDTPAEKIVVTITFDEEDARTLLTIRALFASVAMKEKYLGMGFQEGFGSSLDKLAEVVAAKGGRGAG